ncbi:MAG TPA: UDP-glucose/GDP-mannose dehydrogenase family protein [Pyrinomonadaceae bacterium]|jgi:UDPglucose 6-dehydrogenase
MHIAVIGTGYVGLVTGACFAEFGTEVTCVDINAEKIEGLRKGIIPIYEPGLKELVQKNLTSGRLHFATELAEAVENALVIFLAVGTPPKEEDGSPDLRDVESAARSIAKHINDYKVIVTKSTVPIGTGEHLRALIKEVNPAARFGMVSNPEFLREGAAIEDFVNPDRIVIGSVDEEAKVIMRELYRPLALGDTPILETSLEAAELTKYAANAFLATKISFINEIANLCDSIGCDVHDVAKAIGMDSRIGSKFLHPGPGFGGSCFPKDTRALASVARKFECKSEIVDAVIRVNQLQRSAMVPKIKRLVGELEGKTIAVLGLAFKPDTDDIRESPAVEIVNGLLREGASVRVYDPVVRSVPINNQPKLLYANDEYEAIEKADALVFVTEWKQFRALDMRRVRDAMKSPVIVDLRNIYEPADMRDLGFQYEGVGRK